MPYVARVRAWHLALLWPVWLALAVRPAEQESAADPVNREGLEKNKDEDVEVPVLLPRSCNDEGILQLEPNTVYRTCRPAETDCRSEDMDGGHHLAYRCTELRGAPGASILLATSIYLWEKCRVTGPLVFNLEPGTSELSKAAIIAVDLELYADRRGPLVFRKIRSSGRAVAVFCAHDLQLLGPGKMLFEELIGTGKREPAPIDAKSVNFNSTGHVTFSLCSSRLGGAVLGERVKFLNSGRYEFDNCTSSTDGGAVRAVRVIIDTNAPGFLSFNHCTAKGSGGAIHATSRVLALKGTMSFNNCQASAKGNAIASPHGDVNVSVHTHITVASSDPGLGDLTHTVSADISAATVIIPAGGTVTPKNIMATHKMLAFKEPHAFTTCPPGSHVTLSGSYSAVVPDECVLCPVGSVSLVTAGVHEQGSIEVFNKCMKLVFVRKWSANELRLTHLPRDHGQFIVPGKMPLMWERNGSRMWATAHAGCLEVCPVQGAQNATWENEHILVGSDVAWAPWPIPNSGLCTTTDRPSPRFTIFDVDVDRGTVGLKADPEVVLGIGCDTKYTFEPDPLQTCVPCSDMAINAADKFSCEGGSHIQLRAGYMLVHEAKQRLPKLFRCPNMKACPGGHYSVQMDGQPGIQESICAVGHDIRSEGCSQCIATYGRADLDPFMCQECGGMQLWRRITMEVLASSILFIFALRSAQARTDAQQIFKILLSFVTISARCASTLAFSPYHRELLRLSKLWATAHIAFDIISYIEPGGNSMALDCWLGRPLDVFETLALTLVVPASILLVSLAIAIPWEGLQAGLSCWVIWCNLYMPALTGSVVKLFPCTVTTEEGALLKIFSMHTAAKCSSTVRFGMFQDDEFLLPGVAMLSVVLILGPLLWIYLVQHARDLKIGDSTIINFLVTGYREDIQWWEALVLLRKMAIFAVAVYWPLSSDSRGYSTNLAMVMIAALLMNIKMKPYSNPDLNTLELMVLSMSTLCLVLVGGMQMEWPLQPKTGFAIYIVNLCLLIFLITGTFTYLVVCYYIAGKRRGGNSEQGQPWPSEEPQGAAARAN